MATGDQSDFVSRLKALMPARWFDDSNPILDAVLNGLAQALAWAYSLYLFAALQTRILTSTGGWLDLTAYDFFGDKVKREAGQSDADFLNVIRTNMFRERGTRQSIINVLTDLTGIAPDIVEPTRPLDTGSYGGPMIGYGVAGAYGSMMMPYQAFVTAYRPFGVGIPYVAGYRSTPSGYSQASRGEYAPAANLASLTDAQIYAAIASVKMEGTAVWVRILPSTAK
ncbi:hypothetical protein MXF26_12180 [Pantoea dispersa]|uniref:hypothetical protein n=1 Tax=Pantoea dispersa TaxID=59814 RepID=UPI002DB7269B|nr:hypothetical protein [Pantoea dispersa]MEB5837011.1 hypothetical protein [Pantoea dispersa]